MHQVEGAGLLNSSKWPNTHTVKKGNCNKTNGIRPKMLKNDRLEQDQWNRAN